MSVTIHGDLGVSKVQDGVVETADLAPSVKLGKVLQVVSVTNRTYFVTSTTDTWITTGITATITPASASNSIMCILSPSVMVDKVGGADNLGFLLVYRDGVQIPASFVNIRSYDRGSSGIQLTGRLSIVFTDTPASTSPVTYTLYARIASGVTTIACNTTETASPSVGGATNCSSTITLMEIAA